MWGITQTREPAAAAHARRRRRRGAGMTRGSRPDRRDLADLIARATDWPRDDIDAAVAEGTYADLLWWAWRLGALRPDDPPADVRRWHCAGCDQPVGCHDEPARAAAHCRECRARDWRR